MNTDKATPELFAALAKAQAEVENATKGSTNPHFKSKYADLAEVLNTVRPTFSKHGLSILQSTGFEGSLVSVETVIAHATGGFVSSVASCVPAKSDAQGIGAATTYLRRYGLAAMTGVAQEDDDGQAASHAREPEPVSARKSSAQAKRDGDWEALEAEVEACETLDQLEALVITRQWQETVKRMPRAWVEPLQEIVGRARKTLGGTTAPASTRSATPYNFDNIAKRPEAAQ